MVQKLYRKRSAQLLDAMPPGLSAQERRSVVEDFETARVHVIISYVVKCTFWEDAPWIVVGLAHHDPLVHLAALEMVLASLSRHPE